MCDISKEESIRRQKLLSTLGLCARAGKLVYGIPMICEGMRRGGRGTPIGVFEAGDTSANSHKRIDDKCRYYQIPLIRLPYGGAELAAAVGKNAVLGAVGVTDKAFFEALVKKFTEKN